MTPTTHETEIEAATAAFQCLVAVFNLLETVLVLVDLAADDLGDDHAKEIVDIIQPLMHRVDNMNDRYAALIPTASRQ